MINEDEIFEILEEAVCPYCGKKYEIEKRVITDNPQIFSFKTTNPKTAQCMDFDVVMSEKFYSARSGNLPLPQLRQWVQESNLRPQSHLFEGE